MRFRAFWICLLFTTGVFGQSRVSMIGGDPGRTNTIDGNPMPVAKAPKWRTTPLFTVGGRTTTTVSIEGFPFLSFGILQSPSGHGFSTPMVNGDVIVSRSFLMTASSSHRTSILERMPGRSGRRQRG